VEAVILDTDVFINLQKRSNKKLLFKVLKNFKVYISIITLYEYLFGKKYVGKNVIESKEAIEKVFMIIPLSQQILEKMLEIDVFLSKRGEKLDFRDIAIGASAIVEDLVLVSGNISHFEKMKKLGLKFSPQNEFLNNLKNL